MNEVIPQLAKEDRAIISRVCSNNHFNHQGNGYYFNHTVAETPEYLTLDQAKLLLYYVNQYGKEVLEKFHYNCRAIYWEGNTYYVPTGDIEGTFPGSGCYGMICADGGTHT